MCPYRMQIRITTILNILLAALWLTAVPVDTSFAQSPEGTTHGEDSLQAGTSSGQTIQEKTEPASSVRWGKPDWIKVSLVVGTTAGLFYLDADIQDWVQKTRSDTTDKIASFAKPFGNGRYTLPPLAALYLYGRLAENKKAGRIVLLSLKSFAVTGVFTQVLKYSLHRHRPVTGDPYDTFDGPGFSTKNLSFPSGHSSSAWSILTVVALEYKDSVFIPPLAYGIAALTALSRVHDNAHWASDAFFGSALGYFTAKTVVALHNSGNSENIAVLPVIDGKHGGFLISYRF